MTNILLFATALTKAFRITFLLAPLVWVLVMGLTPMPDRATDEEVMAIRPAAEGSPAAVYAKHQDECWMGNDKAKADMPGAAIIKMRGAGAVYTKAPAKVDAAFSEVLHSIGYEGKDAKAFDVVALCI